MVERIFNDLIAWVILAVIAVLAFLTALIFRENLRKQSDTPNDNGKLSVGQGALIGLEAVILAVLGGLIARAFISFLMGWANDSAAAGVVVGWGFFLVPGIVGTIPFLTHSNPLLTNIESLLMFATVVGGMSGAVDGLWRIYEWEGLGWIAFPLDVTWALAGNTVGCLLHAINFAWGNHSDEHRPNAHRYASGFGFDGFAFTQGCVMSNLDEDSSRDLYHHEMTHVWQNRGFGPMYTLTYIGWFVVWVVPAVIAGLIIEGFAGLVKGPMNWCYFNNPWETWAYAVQGPNGTERTTIIGVTDDDRKMIWPAKYVIAWSVPFFAIATALAVLIAVSAWHGAPAPSRKTKQPVQKQPVQKQQVHPSHAR